MTLAHERQYRGATDVWLTPPALLKAIGPFDLDPCAAPDPRPWATARTMISPPHDGLEARWKGFVFCNPPYGPMVGQWLERMAEHGNGVALVFARTETSAWHRYVWRCADAVLFLRGRVVFHNADGSPADGGHAAAPSALVAYGDRARRRLATSRLRGWLVRLRGNASRLGEP